jgi:hypothetical protein
VARALQLAGGEIGRHYTNRLPDVPGLPGATLMTLSLRRALLVLPLLSLAGCYGSPPSRYFEWQRHEETVRFESEPLYCYRTLARSDCYAQPLDRRELNRIVGYYGPSPARVMMVAPPPLPQEKIGNVIDHPPLMVPREQVQSEPLQRTPPPPSAPLQLVPAPRQQSALPRTD